MALVAARGTRFHNLINLANMPASSGAIRRPCPATGATVDTDERSARLLLWWKILSLNLRAG